MNHTPSLRAPSSARRAAAHYDEHVFQNIASGTSAGVDVGYFLCDRGPSFSWIVSAGLAYQVTEFTGVEDQDLRTDSRTTILGSVLEKDLTRRTKFELAYELTVAQESSDGLLNHSTNSLEIDVTKTAHLDLVFTWDGIAELAANGIFLNKTIPFQPDGGLRLLSSFSC